MSLVNLGRFCCHLQNTSRAAKPLTSVPMSKLFLQISLGLYKQGFISGIYRGDFQGPDIKYTPSTPDNIATRRLWLALKYRNSKPVLNKIQLVSTPSRPVKVTHADLVNLVSGKAFGKVAPLGIGEVMFILEASGQIVEIQDAVRRHSSGKLLCRVS